MRESIGSVFLFNMVIIFIVLVFAVLSATLSYFKAFKVNTRIINAIEKYEGYNDLSKEEIENTLGSLGYRLGDSEDCNGTREGGKAIVQRYRTTDWISAPEQYDYCIYLYEDEEDPKHYSYGVVTYINFDLPLIRAIKVPIYSKSNRIFDFSTIK